MLNWLFLLDTPYYGGYLPSSPPLREPREPDPYIEARLHSLEVACAGLWELLKQKNGYTDDELIAIIKQVDQKRGEITPSLGGPASVCPKCGHKMLTHDHRKCLWCGASLDQAPFQQ